MKSFDEVFIDKTKYGTKVKTDGYHDVGKNLIIDQGQKVVAGYTDQEDGIFDDVPVIIFGDHTRVVKYIDKPFFLGADGVKVLRCKLKDANYKYLYYALKNAKIPDTGYNRHFKWLKEVVLRYPCLDEQSRIVEVLDKVNDVINARKKELEELDNLIKSRFIEMFNNNNFEKDELNRNVEEMFIGPFGSSLKNDCFVEKDKSYCMVYEQKHAIQKTMNVPTRYVNYDKFKELQRFNVIGGDIIVSCRGTIGEIYSVPINAPLGIMHPSIMKIRLKKDKYCNLFFVYLLEQYMQENINKANGTGIKMAVSAKELGKERFVLPPIHIQKDFENFVKQTDKLKIEVQKSLDKTQLLFNSLMQEYFG